MTLKELSQDLERIGESITRLAISTGYERDDYLSNVSIDLESADERFLLKQYTRVIESLYQQQEKISRATAPVSYTGYLHKGQNGRYAADNHEMSSGSRFEALVYDQETGANEWKLCHMEYSHEQNEYYIPNISEPAEGLFIRIRR